MELEARPMLFSHLPEEALEKYAFGRLSANEIEAFEVHLLHCEYCQARLEAEDNFAEAMHVLEQMNESHACGKEPAASPDSPHPRKLGTWRALLVPSGTHWASPVWGVGLFALLFVGIGTWKAPLAQTNFREPQTVTLSALRGASDDGVAAAKAGHPINLAMNIASLASSPPEAGPYRLEVVDSVGDPRWTSMVTATETGDIQAPLGRSLGKGVYWVRLYAPAGKLLREFGLHLN
jgi:Putative zinc-finger